MSASARVRVTELDGGRVRSREDRVAVEEPLEIRVDTGDGPLPLAVTMRTPGDDLELAAGFLFGEGVVTSAADVVTIRHCARVPRDRRDNTVTARLADAPLTRATALARRFTVSSACGVCGIESIDELQARGLAPVQRTDVEPDRLAELPARLRAAQRTFDSTGGLHAAGLVDPGGELLCVREDVGRHNAVDKVVGWALTRDLLPLHGCTLVVSGRTSFELAHKAVAAGVGVLAGVSAPSSLAVEVAERFGLSLVGFLRGERFVLYAGSLAAEPSPPR